MYSTCIIHTQTHTPPPPKKMDKKKSARKTVVKKCYPETHSEKRGAILFLLIYNNNPTFFPPFWLKKCILYTKYYGTCICGYSQTLYMHYKSYLPWKWRALLTLTKVSRLFVQLLQSAFTNTTCKIKPTNTLCSYEKPTVE